MAKQYDPEYCFSQIINAGVNKIIISDPANKNEPCKKIVIQPKAGIWQIESYLGNQVFHENVLQGELNERLFEIVIGHYRQVNAFALESEHIILISKKGICMYKIKKNDKIEVAPAELLEHNRRKHYIIEEGQIIPPLVDMGIFSKDGKVISSMHDKFRQINRFIELIDDEIKDIQKPLNIIDFGCGKSYLTFVIYYYFTEIRKIDVNIVGLDLKADVIDKCNAAALKYGYDNLHFEVGDVNGYAAPFDVDMVVTLHACDTATDYALYNAVKWNAKYIFSVPCCQHELNSQIGATDDFSILTRYGIVKERFSALATDAIRSNLLEYCGYKTQLLEFIDLEGTPKNLLIRAVRRGEINSWLSKRYLPREEKYLREVLDLNSTFSFKPTLLRLLGVDEKSK